jgi:hypothetical protein
VTGGAGSNRRAGITYRVVHADGEFVTQIDQSATANAWVSLGTFRFAAGSGGYVEMTNEAVDLSGRMYAAAVKLEPVAGNLDQLLAFVLGIGGCLGMARSSC